MKYNILTTICLFSLLRVAGQDPAIRMEELSAPEFIKAVEKSSGTCIIPIGVFEKHGPIPRPKGQADVFINILVCSR